MRTRPSMIPQRGKRYVDKLHDAVGDEKFIRGVLAAMSQQEAIHTGDQVKLNAAKIMERDEFKNTRKDYQEFVKNNQDTVFTAHVRDDKLVCFNEDGSGHIFWRGDLIKQ